MRPAHRAGCQAQAGEPRTKQGLSERCWQKVPQQDRSHARRQPGLKVHHEDTCECRHPANELIGHRELRACSMEQVVPSPQIKSAQREIVHEPPLAEGDPPLVRRAVDRVPVALVHDAPAGLFPELLEIASHKVCLLPGLRAREEAAQREVPLPRDGEGLQGHGGEALERLPTRLAVLHAAQALRGVQRQVHEEPVRGALDLKGAKEHVGAEVVEHLVDDVLPVVLDGGGRAPAGGADGEH
eukprot:CAMPEP_0206009568 /NCGR_PEP_ID=MMETSP1464-20131121/9928_1 /ASSEMBLY_ACC=CAM_ASM_001124 /TAXON_ID=119497 /ORGANISM="Exanthemachrysis gayraliae, Strain RCC1523" /LENGTH=240 /DNA_ID=CAMNT_0053383165 /DNA_START=1 /DNA_END=724 /DNA_ORIENTATION=+